MASMSERQRLEQQGAEQVAVNPLENLSLLEKKIAQLIELVKAEKALNAQLIRGKGCIDCSIADGRKFIAERSKEY